MTRVTPVTRFGTLESQVMEVIWLKGSASVREVHDSLSKGHDVAYTTILTVMQRLAKKGMLLRIIDGNSHIYAATLSKEAYCGSLMRTFLGVLSKPMAARTLVHFVEEMDDEQMLADLERLIHEKRASL
ncbi:MAG: BlaI/MecI/CopY family transcriptional regulator [Candidatus Aquicultorales bacterium]